MFTLADITPDYVFYSDIYHGRRLTEDAFIGGLSDAVGEVEHRIWPNAELDESKGERCKMAVCAIAEAADPNSRLRSYSAGKTSESFDAHPFSMQSEAICRRYLANQGVLKGGRWL